MGASRKRFGAEEVVKLLRQIEVLQGTGKSLPETCKAVGIPLIRGLDIKVILGSSDPRQQLSSLGISRLTGLRNRWHAVERRRVFFALEVPRVPDTLAELIKVEVLSAEVILSVLMGAA